jgi:hypothetical protein
VRSSAPKRMRVRGGICLLRRLLALSRSSATAGRRTRASHRFVSPDDALDDRAAPLLSFMKPSFDPSSRLEVGAVEERRPVAPERGTVRAHAVGAPAEVAVEPFASDARAALPRARGGGGGGARVGRRRIWL